MVTHSSELYLHLTYLHTYVYDEFYWFLKKTSIDAMHDTYISFSAYVFG
jgi:hypothetical protein